MLQLWYTVCCRDDLHLLHKSIRIRFLAHPSRPGSPRGTALLTGAWQSWSICGQAGLLNIWECQTSLENPPLFSLSNISGWEGGICLIRSFIHTILHLWVSPRREIHENNTDFSCNFWKLLWRELRKWNISTRFLCFQNLIEDWN